MYSTQKSNDVVVVHVTPPFDSSLASQAEEFFRDLPLSITPNVVADLSDLNFIDSSGLGALVAGLKAARQKQGDLRLCGLTAPVQSIFKLTRLSRLFDIFEDAEGAITSFE